MCPVLFFDVITSLSHLDPHQAQGGGVMPHDALGLDLEPGELYGRGLLAASGGGGGKNFEQTPTYAVRARRAPPARAAPPARPRRGPHREGAPGPGCRAARGGAPRGSGGFPGPETRGARRGRPAAPRPAPGEVAPAGLEPVPAALQGHPGTQGTYISENLLNFNIF